MCNYLSLNACQFIMILGVIKSILLLFCVFDCVCNQCRVREAELEKQFQLDLANTEADHLQKTEHMLVEFNRAQQLLKDKIVKQQNMYVWLALLLLDSVVVVDEFHVRIWSSVAAFIETYTI